MRVPTPPSPLLLTLLSFLPYVLSSTLLDNGPGNTLCLSLSAIDLTHATEDLLGINTDIKVNVGLGLCLCIYEGVLTVPAEAALKAAVTGDVVSHVTSVLGLSVLGLSHADVQEGIKAAVLVLLQEGHTSCSYPSHAIPSGCVGCDWVCDATNGFRKCRDKCLPAGQPCPSGNSNSRRAGAVHAYIKARSAEANRYAPADAYWGNTNVNGQLDYGIGLEHGHAYGRRSDSNANLDVDANVKAQAEIEAHLLELGISCPKGQTPCGLGGDYKRGDKRGVDQAWECVDIQNDLECCGGCLHPIFGGLYGKDCTGMPGVNSVSCVKGRCYISSCHDGWRWDSNLNICVQIDVNLSADLSGNYKHGAYV